jgi:hypothetical protein
MKIIYIHGFNSAGYGEKINHLRKAFGDENVITPTLPPNPEKAIKLLEYLVGKMKDDDLYLVGTSLGGYYALYLTNKYKVPSVIINPSLKPYDSLKDQVGTQTNYKTDEVYEFKKEYIDFLKNIEFSKEDLEKNKDKIFVYLDEEDELLDSKETAEYFKDFYVKMYPGGNHRFSHMKELIEDMKNNILVRYNK